MGAAANNCRIGHPAYTGANRSQWVGSKSAAVAALRERGVKRDDARAAVNRVFDEKAGSCGATVYGGLFGSDVIEIAYFT